MKNITGIIVTLPADDGADWDVHLDSDGGIVLVEIVRDGEVVCTVMPDGFHSGDHSELLAELPDDTFEIDGCDFDLESFVKAAL